MSLGTNRADDKDVRDVNGDYIKAYLVEYEKFTGIGDDRAQLVAKELRSLGHDVKPKSAPAKERAVNPEALERAVEADAPPRGRPPRKPAE